ncbi:MAG: HNH endonuclease [Methylophilaceae bacterium]
MKDFIKARESLEKIIFNYDDLPRQIVRKYRTSVAGTPYVVDFYLEAIRLINSGLDMESVVTKIISSQKFNYLTLKPILAQSDEYSNDFHSNAKSQVFINEALKNSIKCKICNGYLHTNSISIDHIDRKQDGGLGSPDNGQISHPYCNTGYKN